MIIWGVLQSIVAGLSHRKLQNIVYLVYTIYQGMSSTRCRIIRSWMPYACTPFREGFFINRAGETYAVFHPK